MTKTWNDPRLNKAQADLEKLQKWAEETVPRIRELQDKGEIERYNISEICEFIELVEELER